MTGKAARLRATAHDGEDVKAMLASSSLGSDQALKIRRQLPARARKHARRTLKKATGTGLALSNPVVAALLGAAAIVIAAATVAGFQGGFGSSPHPTPVPLRAGKVIGVRWPSGPSGRFYTETTGNHLGTDVFSDPAGDAVTSGPVSIPYGTHVEVRCWAPAEAAGRPGRARVVQADERAVLVSH